MKKILTVLFFFVLSLPAAAQLSGTKTIGSGGDYASIAAAILDLNSNGVSGPVVFELTDATYNETGSNLLINITSNVPTSTNTVTFKPASGVQPTVNITSCTNVAGPSQYAGFTINGNSHITIDGSNNGSSSKDLTFKMNDATNGRIIIQLYGNTDTLVIKNLNLIYGGTPAGPTTSRGIYANGQSTGAADSVLIQNCSIGDGTRDPAYSISITGSSGSSIYCTKIYAQNNILYGTLRRVYFYYVGTTGTVSEISGNQIYGVNAPPTGNVAWGIIFNTYNGTINIYNNKLPSLRSVTTGTEGLYSFGTLTGQSGVILNIYNNFFGGDFQHTGTGTPASIDVVSFQDAPASAVVRFYYNTVVLNNMTKTASSRMTCLRFNPVSGSTFDIKNNILINNKDASIAYGYHFGGSSTTFTADYNNVYLTGTGAKVGYFNSTAKTNLSDWQSASSQDAHSKSVAVTFTSATDLSLAGGSIGDNNLVGTPLSSPYDKDIEGDSRNSTYPYMGADEKSTLIYPLAMHTVTMSASVNNATAFGNNGLLGTDGSAKFYAHWDASYLYLGWSGGRTNYSSDLFYAAIDTDPDGINGTSSAIDNIDFLSGSPSPDFYVVYENNSAYYGSPVTNGNAFEVYNVSGGNWNWVSRTDGNDNISSKIIFDDSNGEVRLRVAWSTLGVTPSASTKLGLVMWNNNGDANYMWARVPGDNPSNGSTPKTLTHGISFSSTGIGVNPSSSGSNYWLPVELTSFTAVSKGNNVELQWKTATETNNAGFEVERRLGSEWVKVGFVEGAGTSNTIKEYRYSDVVKANGSIGYRLKQIDRTGAFTYSNVVEVVVAKGPESFTLGQNYPNPFNPTTTINFSVPQTEHATLKVFDITGKEVTTLFNETAQSGQTYNVQFNANGLASGIYLYVLQTPTNRVVKKMLLMK